MFSMTLKRRYNLAILIALATILVAAVMTQQLVTIAPAVDSLRLAAVEPIAPVRLPVDGSNTSATILFTSSTDARIHLTGGGSMMILSADTLSTAWDSMTSATATTGIFILETKPLCADTRLLRLECMSPEEKKAWDNLGL